MQLTQLKTIKVRLEIDNADTTDDAILSAALVGISQRAVNESNRAFDYQAAATFVFRGDDLDIRVDRYPLISVAGFETKSNEADGWQAVTGADVPDFLIGPAGNIIELSEQLGSSRQVARVTFAGGYSLPGTTNTGVPALPDDLEQSVIEQVCYWYQRRAQLGVTSMSGDGGSVSFFSKLDLLPGVQAVIKRYERYML
jgi:hypothetical protein